MEDHKSDKSPVVDSQVVSYNLVNSTKLQYRWGDFEKKSVLSNSALSCQISYTPSQLNNETNLVKITHKSTFNPSIQKIENTASFLIGLPLYGSVNFWKQVSNNTVNRLFSVMLIGGTRSRLCKSLIHSTFKSKTITTFVSN